MRALGLLLLILGICPPAFAELAGVVGDSVNIRVGPSERSEVVGTLRAGDRVTVADWQGEWAKIVPPEGMSAFVFSEYLRAGEVVGERVNYRTGPGLSYARLGQLARGEKISPLEVRGEWTSFPLPASVRFWVASAYLDPAPLDLPAPAGTFSFREEAVIPAWDPAPAATPVSPLPEPSPVAVFSSPARSPGSPVSPIVVKREGYIRPLPAPEQIAGRLVKYRLFRSRPESGPLGWLCGENIELSRYLDRKVRIYAIEIPAAAPAPLYEVKGIQVLW